MTHDQIVSTAARGLHEPDTLTHVQIQALCGSVLAHRHPVTFEQRTGLPAVAFGLLWAASVAVAGAFCFASLYQAANSCLN